jgi:hypothetical protein
MRGSAESYSRFDLAPAQSVRSIKALNDRGLKGWRVRFGRALKRHSPSTE